VHRICLKLNGDTVCVPIPVLLVGLKPGPDPDPGPLREIVDGWITADGAAPSAWKSDLPVLATVAALAEIAESPQVTDALAEVSRFYLDRIAARLPEGISLELEETAAAKS
jgi:hypothetical protein